MKVGQDRPGARDADQSAGEAGPKPADMNTAMPASRQPGRIEIEGNCEGNVIELGDNITLAGTIIGQGNVIRIAGTKNPQTLYLNIHGNNNKVRIGANSLLQKLRVEIGSKRWLCSRARLIIGRGFSIASHGRFILPNSKNVVEIGANCMFSSNIVVRGGEYPHLIFDKESGDYLDVSDGIFIGDHVWVGEGAFIGKSATLPDDCIVGARSVVTKRFEETHCVIAGNPSRVVKRGVQWVENEYLLAKEFPIGREKFAEAQVNQINRVERKRATAAVKLSAQASAAPVEPD